MRKPRLPWSHVPKFTEMVNGRDSILGRSYDRSFFFTVSFFLPSLPSLSTRTTCLSLQSFCCKHSHSPNLLFFHHTCTQMLSYINVTTCLLPISSPGYWALLEEMTQLDGLEPFQIYGLQIYWALLPEQTFHILLWSNYLPNCCSLLLVINWLTFQRESRLSDKHLKTLLPKPQT